MNRLHKINQRFERVFDLFFCKNPTDNILPAQNIILLNLVNIGRKRNIYIHIGIISKEHRKDCRKVVRVWTLHL